MTDYEPPHNPSDPPSPSSYEDPVDIGSADDAVDAVAAIADADQLDSHVVPDSVTGSAATAETDDTHVSDFSDEELLGAAEAPAFGDTEDIEEPTPDFSEPAAETEPNTPDDPPPAASAGPPPNSPPRNYPPNSPPPSGSYGPAPVRRIYRSVHDRRVGGVSAGIAEYFRVDPTLVRVLTLLFLCTGVGIFVYLAAWIIIPSRPEGFVDPRPPVPQPDERTLTIAFGVGALAVAFGIITGSWAVLSLALIGGGIWLLSEHTRVLPAMAGGVPGAPPAPAMAYQQQDWSDQEWSEPQWSGQQLSGQDWSGSEAGSAAATSAPPVPPSPAPRRKRQRQSVTWTVLSMLALLAAVGVAAASGDWWDVSATRFLGIGLVIIGIGVVVGQLRRGGARGLIPLGILAAIALFPVSAVDGLLDEGVGESIHRPSDFTELSTTYEHGVGALTVDLSRLDFTGRSDTIDIELGIGELIVIVSDDMGGQATIEANAGEIRHEMTPGSSRFTFQDGVNIESGIVELSGPDGTVELNIGVGLGTAELRTRSN